MNTYFNFSLGEYYARYEKDALRSIPCMCMLTINWDNNILPACTKSRIVVLGNHKDRIWTKSEKYASIL